MAARRCFDQSCQQKIQYVCRCSSPETYFCELHFDTHLKLPNITHTFESLSDLYEGTKDEILEFLTKERTEKEALKEKFLSSFSQSLFKSESSLKKSIETLNSDLAIIGRSYQKISQTQKILKQEQDPVLQLLAWQSDEAIESMKTMISSNPESYSNANLFCTLSEEIKKMFQCFIDEKFENFLSKRLSKIEKKLEAHDKLLRDELSKVKNATTNLENENKENKAKLEGWSKEIQSQTQHKINCFSNQLNSTLENLNKKLNEIKAQDLLNQKTLNQLSVSQELKIKSSAILSKLNYLEAEQNFRETCSLYKNSASNLALSQAYQKYTDAYHQMTSLYLIKSDDNGKTDLIVYDTESEREDLKSLDYIKPLDTEICITQLPKGELFCFGDYPPSGVTFIIGKKLRIQPLPSGTPCFYSSAVYFNKSVYCFGGVDNLNDISVLSCRFDLSSNKWISLNPLPEADYKCNSIIFKKNILISGFLNKNLWRYSVDNDYFTTILYEFAEGKRKILINSERLYLIECEGFIYENDSEDLRTWNRLSTSMISYNAPSQVFCSYNKGGVYIGISCSEGDSHCCSYYKFDLNHKAMVRT